MALIHEAKDVQHTTAERLLVRHGLHLVTSSVLCDGPALPPLAGSSMDDYGYGGDGMAMPLEDVRRNNERMVDQLKRDGTLQPSAWPAAGPSAASDGSPPTAQDSPPWPLDSRWQLHSASYHSSAAALHEPTTHSGGNSMFSGPSWGHAAGPSAAGASMDNRALPAPGMLPRLGAGAAALGMLPPTAEVGYEEEDLGSAEGMPAGMPPPNSSERSVASKASREAAAVRGAGTYPGGFKAGSVRRGSPVPRRQAKLLQSVTSGLGRMAAMAVAAAEPLVAAAADLRAPMGRAALVAAAVASQAARTAVRGAAKATQQVMSVDMYGNPSSSWLVVDDPSTNTRYMIIQAGPDLARKAPIGQDLVTFEKYDLGCKVNRLINAEATALYARSVPLVMEFLEAVPNGRVCFGGAGLGGSLATLLQLMHCHRGLRYSSMLPAVAIDAPAVLGHVPNAKLWSASKDGFVYQDADDVLEDLLSHGILEELGLPQDAVHNVQTNPSPAAGAAAAAAHQAEAHETHGSRVQQLLGAMARAVAGSKAGEALGPSAGLSGIAGLVLDRDGDPVKMQMFKPIGSTINGSLPAADGAGDGNGNGSGAHAGMDGAVVYSHMPVAADEATTGFAGSVASVSSMDLNGHATVWSISGVLGDDDEVAGA